MSEKDHTEDRDAHSPERKTDREHFYVCPVCSERVDWRDQAEVMRHAAHAK